MESPQGRCFLEDDTRDSTSTTSDLATSINETDEDEGLAASTPSAPSMTTRMSVRGTRSRRNRKKNSTLFSHSSNTSSSSSEVGSQVGDEPFYGGRRNVCKSVRQDEAVFHVYAYFQQLLGSLRQQAKILKRQENDTQKSSWEHKHWMQPSPELQVASLSSQVIYYLQFLQSTYPGLTGAQTTSAPSSSRGGGGGSSSGNGYREDYYPGSNERFRRGGNYYGSSRGPQSDKSHIHPLMQLPIRAPSSHETSVAENDLTAESIDQNASSPNSKKDYASVASRKLPAANYADAVRKSSNASQRGNGSERNSLTSRLNSGPKKVAAKASTETAVEDTEAVFEKPITHDWKSKTFSDITKGESGQSSDFRILHESFQDSTLNGTETRSSPTSRLSELGLAGETHYRRGSDDSTSWVLEQDGTTRLLSLLSDDHESGIDVKSDEEKPQEEEDVLKTKDTPNSPPNAPPIGLFDPNGEYMVSNMDVLSEEIWHFHNNIAQTEATLARKLHLRDSLYMAICQVFPMCGLYIVGSSLNGFGNDSSDMDLCLMISLIENLNTQTLKDEAMVVLNMVHEQLKGYRWVSNLQLITAKVPILRVKFADPYADITVDLNVNNAVAIRNTHLLSYYSNFDWRVRPLVSVVKEWAKRKDINDANRSSFTSYSLVLMVIHYLQCGVNSPILPSLQHLYPKRFCARADVRTLNVAKPLEPPPRETWTYNDEPTLSDLLIGFLEYYALKFDYDNQAISVKLGRRVERSVVAKQRPVHEPHNENNSWRAQWRCVCIEEPFTLTNTAHSVYDEMIFGSIKEAFLEGFNQLNSHRDMHKFLDTTPIQVNASLTGSAIMYALSYTQRTVRVTAPFPQGEEEVQMPPLMLQPSVPASLPMQQQQTTSSPHGGHRQRRQHAGHFGPGEHKPPHQAKKYG